MPSTVHLIDASPYIFRAYFSLPSSMTSPDGAQVNAVYGFANFLAKYAQDEDPSHVGIAFDGSLTTSFRNDLYPEYKAQRDLPPAELEAQLDACRDVAKGLGFVTWIDDRYEADDLIGTAVEQVLSEGANAVVVSSDKDMSQLVSDRVELFDYARDARYDAQAVKQKMGVPPSLVADFLGLAGDSVDNIPGVAGVGPKTAVALLTKLGGLDDVYADLGRVAELDVRGAKSLAAKLEEHREIAELSRELATIARTAPMTTGVDELEWAGADADAVDELFARLGFEGLKKRIPRWA